MQLPPYLLGTAASLYVFADVIRSLVNIFYVSNAEIIRLGFIAFAAIALQLAITAACGRRCNNEIYINFVAAVFFSLNLILFHLILLPDFVLAHTAIKILIFAGVTASFFAVLWKGHPTIVTWLTIIMIVAAALAAAKTSNDLFNMEPVPIPDNDYQASIKRKPNIYLLSFDGLMDQDMFHIHFPASDAEPAHIARLKELGAESIDNGAAYDDTIMTFNLMLAMNYTWWENLPTELHKRRLLTGEQNSVLYDFLNRNGYTISLVYVNDYLSRGEKTNINFHYLHRHSNVCHKSGELTKLVAFWFYCQIFVEPADQSKYLDFMDITLQQLVTSPQPHKFVLAYWTIPGHVDAFSYDWHNKENVRSFKNQYLANITTTADVISRSVNFIKLHDPGAIILVFGDHGAFITKGTKPEEKIFTREQQYMDTRGITLAAINHGNCQLQADTSQIPQAYLSYINHALMRLMACLAHGE